MSDFSDYLENQVLDHVFVNTPYTSPSAVYLALYTSAPTDAGGGTQVSGNGYARQAISFDAAAAGVTTSTAPVSFTASGGNFGTIVAVGIFDAATAGNFLAWKAITPVTINDTDTLTFPSGDISVTLD